MSGAPKVLISCDMSGMLRPIPQAGSMMTAGIIDTNCNQQNDWYELHRDAATAFLRRRRIRLAILPT